MSLANHMKLKESKMTEVINDLKSKGFDLFLRVEQLKAELARCTQELNAVVQQQQTLIKEPKNDGDSKS